METKTHFAPLLYLPNGITDIDFYKRAFKAVEQFRYNNDDGSMHVVELKIGDAIFHVHEMNDKKGRFSLEGNATGVSVLIGLFTDDVHAVFNQAIASGATELSPVIDYDYGYRQGELKDPFGHVWVIQKKIDYL